MLALKIMAMLKATWQDIVGCFALMPCSIQHDRPQSYNSKEFKSCKHLNELEEDTLPNPASKLQSIALIPVV